MTRADSGADTGPHAAALDEAATTASPVDQITATRALTLDEAYRVQAELLACRHARGEREVGLKLGFTSEAKMAQMGISEVIAGRLTDAMRVADGGTTDRRRFIHPRVEPEIAFRLSGRVEQAGPNADPAEVIDAVAPALEIIDSRYRDFRFTLEDVVADNTSAAGYVTGPWTAFDRAHDITNLGVMLETDGQLADTGSTAAILGDPLRAVAAAVRLATRYGMPLHAGSVVLAGAATAAHWLSAATHVEVTVAELGRATLRTHGGEHDDIARR
ncbi:fumarylacetoacetate hydrolase family protein [Haloechinothrix sp. YIM 98757]|uniref:Fumarylacetoacetate hydrolase family protein n=1 Tax=Haloechinothrix aidingensis TaxID=2752311 RepID=A0A838A7J9_9PSEU|nr:fumarylacetoacetate hydrolase family protein [Haloechinothrix aidingensis]MBA0124269.1 fumarylacetoacetate hydrolase family protein [Haloechinothrix aidingensis]